MNNILNQPLKLLKNIGPKFLKKFQKLEIETIKDLLWHFPYRYENFSQVCLIKNITPHQEITIKGLIKEIKTFRTWRNRFYITEALIQDESGTLKAVWFNQPYLKNILKPGQKFNFSGIVKIKNNELYLNNPIYEASLSYGETKHTARIIPIYPETKGLTSKAIRNFIKPILDGLKKLDDFLPEEILKKENLPSLLKALKDIHFPKKIEDALNAQKRFAFEDIFLIQIHNLLERIKINHQKAYAFKIDLEHLKKNLKKLPFELTFSQKKVLWEILKDLEKNQPMNRLLQGDVGSGKTIIAALTALEIAKNQYQTAFMAPTEILARQHYETFKKFFFDFENGLCLLTSSEAKVYYGYHLETSLKKKQLYQEIKANKIKIVIGTHALIQKEVIFDKLALVIIDEQHRFGVEQRASLLKKHQTEKNQPLPHFLSMSATPIPRTLALTIFGDLDISVINELPKNRKPIITKIITPKNKEKAYQFIRQEIKKGRQAFVICSRIEENQKHQDKIKAEVKSVKTEYKKLSQTIFPDLKIALLHGKMKPKEKEKIMNDFLQRKIDILVATSVIEVGIDVPNATIMMIENAERFGLAQLYQFKGRVGRGEHQSYCFLFTETNNKKSYQRLYAILTAKNGLVLAEKDLKLRGPGEFLGQAQTGLPDLAMKALKNLNLVKKSRLLAFEIIKKDPSLKKYPLLLKRIKALKKEVHLE